MPVTFWSPVSRSRTCSVPSNSRTYAIFSPAGPRSTLNTDPDSGACGSPAAGGSSVAIPPVSSATPAPVIAEPKNTGCTCARRVCAARQDRNRPNGTDPSSTYAASKESSDVDSWLSSRAGSAGSGPVATVRVPASRAVVIGTTAGVSLAAISPTTRSGSAPARSILLTNSSVGSRSRRSARISTRVCGCTPSTAETTSTAPSSTVRTRSTSAMKSGWPGVSMRLTVTSPIANETTADLIVIPRCRSSASVSVCVLPASTLPISSMMPALCSSRSVRLVLPASTCARMPRLSRATVRHVLEVGRVGGHERSRHRAPPGRRVVWRKTRRLRPGNRIEQCG